MNTPIWTMYLSDLIPWLRVMSLLIGTGIFLTGLIISLEMDRSGQKGGLKFFKRMSIVAALWFVLAAAIPSPPTIELMVQSYKMGDT